MASKFGMAGGIPERRVRPVWDAIDSRQFKNALKLSTTLLSKYPNSSYALVSLLSDSLLFVWVSIRMSSSIPYSISVRKELVWFNWLILHSNRQQFGCSRQDLGIVFLIRTTSSDIPFNECSFMIVHCFPLADSPW